MRASIYKIVLIHISAESSPQAIALGYKENAMSVDKSKYPRFSTDQGCHSCALYQGLQGSTYGRCALFAGKNVSASGWCSAFARKAASPAPQPAYVAPQKAVNTGLTIDAAKVQCTDLGFKAGTEGFGKCVLQLSK
jgi:hypothetical protein